jgi:hypothetical protein
MSHPFRLYNLDFIGFHTRSTILIAMLHLRKQAMTGNNLIADFFRRHFYNEPFASFPARESLRAAAFFSFITI